MTLNYTGDQVLERITAFTHKDAKIISGAFKKQTQQGHLTLHGVKALIETAMQDGLASNFDLMALSDIRDYAGLKPDAFTYLNRYLQTAFAFGATKTFPDGVPLAPVLQRTSNTAISALYKASMLRVSYSLPDQPQLIYRFRDLVSIATHILNGRIQLFALRTAGDIKGGYIRAVDTLSLIENANRTHWHTEGTAVHEGMHAVQDARKVYGDQGHIEVAAHLAQAVYLLDCRQPLENKLARAPIADIAEELLDASRSLQPVHFAIPQGQYPALRDATTRGTNYKPNEELTDADGIAKGNTPYRHP